MPKPPEEYCACGADKMSAEFFSTAEIKQLMSNQYNQCGAAQQRRLDAIQSCLPQRRPR
jgi:hypothetical protein